MGNENRDVAPLVLKFGVALAVSFGGIIYTLMINKRCKASQSSHDDPYKHSDCNNQVISRRKSQTSLHFDPLENNHEESHHLKNTAYESFKGYSRSDKDTREQEIKSLRNTIKILKERESNLEMELIEYYGLKEQETAVMELQNRLKLNNMEAKIFTLKIESLQADNKRLEAQITNNKKVVADLEAARSKIKVLKKKLKSETEQHKKEILDFQQRVQKMQDNEQKWESSVDKLKGLESEVEVLRKSNHNLLLENADLARRLDSVQILATSVLEDAEATSIPTLQKAICILCFRRSAQFILFVSAGTVPPANPFGYVNFHLPSHAVDALRGLNHSELRGKPIRVMWVEKDPCIRKSGTGNLFVKNLDLKVNEGKLEKIFGVFGWIHSCKIARDDDGNSKGFGFVQFYSEESASNALSALNGSIFYGKVMTVAKYLKKDERNEPQFTNVYVKNLDEGFTESSLKERFSEYGKITSVVIMNDAQGKSRGFGFVNFESHENAKKAIEALNGAQIGTQKWFVGKAMKKAQRDAFLEHAHQEQTQKISNLFVRNLATSVTEKNLCEVFGAFGSVTLAKVPCYENGVSKGVALVCFTKPEEAKKAMDSLNGSFYHGKYMNVSLAPSKDEIAKRLQATSALRCTVPLTHMVPNLQKSVEKPAKKEKPANGACSCDDNDNEDDGFVLVD